MKQFDTVVIFGAAVKSDGSPSNALRRRVQAALAFTERTPETRFLVTGGIGRYPPAEAEVMRQLLREGGVTEQNILMEPLARDTLESIRYCLKILPGLDGCARVFVCTDDYHVPRCRWLFQRAGLATLPLPAYGSRQQNPWHKSLWFHVRELPAIVLDTILLALAPGIP